MTKITFISDTHNYHKKIDRDLPGGDIIVHSGDISSMGYIHEIKQFLYWYNTLPGYQYKVMIAGNHDFGFQNNEPEVLDLLDDYPNVIYLKDNMDVVDGLRIWGSPWQPEFYDWAFNLPRNGEQLKSKWAMIPEDIDILITHGPPFGYLDKVKGQLINIGCELLRERIDEIKPKIHVFGHIHSGRGVLESNGTFFVNASVLNEQYQYAYSPITIDFDNITKKIDIIDY